MSEEARSSDPAFRVEDDQVSLRALAVTAVVACVVGVVAVLVSSAILAGATGGARPAPPVQLGPQIGIVEQTLIAETRRGLDEKDRQRRSLDRLDWVDRPHGLARIPIDDAMNLVTDPAFLREVEVRSRRGAAGGGP